MDLTSIASVAALVVVITEYFKKIVKLDGFLIQLTAWIISVVLGFLASYFNLGMFAGMGSIEVLVNGILIGFVANGIFDIELVKKILAALKLR